MKSIYTIRIVFGTEVIVVVLLIVHNIVMVGMMLWIISLSMAKVINHIDVMIEPQESEG